MCTCVCKLCKGGRRWGAAEGWCPRGPVRHQGPSRDSGGREDPGLCPGQRDVVSWRGQVSGGPSQPAVGLTSAGAEGLFGKVVSGSRLTAGHMAVRRGKRDLRLVDPWGPGDVLATVRNGRGSRTVGAPGGAAAQGGWAPWGGVSAAAVGPGRLGGRQRWYQDALHSASADSLVASAGRVSRSSAARGAVLPSDGARLTPLTDRRARQPRHLSRGHRSGDSALLAEFRRPQRTGH